MTAALLAFATIESSKVLQAARASAALHWFIKCRIRSQLHPGPGLTHQGIVALKRSPQSLFGVSLRFMLLERGEVQGNRC